MFKFRGIAKGIFNPRIYESLSKGDRKGLWPGLSKHEGNRTKVLNREKVFEFYTNKSGTFAATIVKTGQTAVWDFGDGQTAVSNAVSITYANTGVKKVRVFLDDPKLVTQLSVFNNLGILGTFDLRMFVNCVSFRIYDNSGITKLLWPRPSKGVVQATNNIRTYSNIEHLDLSMAENMSYLVATSCNLRRGINLPKSSSVTYFEMSATSIEYLNLQSLVLGSTFLMQNCTNLKSILFGPSSNTIGSFIFTGNTALTGTLDISMLTAMATTLQLNGNSALTAILFGASASNFTFIDFYSCNITGTVDLSGFSGNVSSLRGNNNPNLTGITLNNTGKSYNYFYFAACNITGTLDCTGIVLGGYFNVSNNANLTSITHAASAAAWVSGYFAAFCNLTGTLNLSGLSALGVDIRLNNNPLLTAVTWPTSSTVITQFLLNGCNITGGLNISSLTGWGTSVRFQVQGNALMTSITLASHATTTFLQFFAQSCAITTINFLAMPKLTEQNSCVITLQDNGMSSAQVDQILIDLDTNATNGFTSRQIIINGTNAAPGAAGLVAKTSLVTKGFTVSTN